MATYLKQSTAVEIALGPFLDSSDGFTAETALTIAQADVRLKKNGGAWAQKNDATAATHEEAGWYECPLNATDTGTLGTLVVAVQVAGALPVWREFQVLPAVVYDSLVAGSDLLQTDLQQWRGAVPAVLTDTDKVSVSVQHTAATLTYNLTGNVSGSVGSVTGDVGGNVVGSVGSLATQAKADVNTEVDAALADYDAPTQAELTAAFTEIKGATWSSATDTLEALRDRGDAAWVTATGFSTHSAADVWAVATRTLTASLDPSAAAIADAVWDEVRSGHVAAGSFGEYVPANVTHWLGTAAATPTVAGVPEVDITHVGGTAASPAGSVEATLSAAEREAVADATLARSVASVEATAGPFSLAGLILLVTNSDTTTNAGFATAFMTDGLTEFAQYTVTADAAAEAITSIKG